MPTEASEIDDGLIDDLYTLESGLDALDHKQKSRQSISRRVARAVLPGVLGALAVLAIWQLLFALNIKEDWALPSPSMVWDALLNQNQQGFVWPAVKNSVSRGFVGFAMSLLIATPLGILIARVRLIGAVLRPVVTGLQQLPSVAWVPAAIIWFGLTPSTIYCVVILGATPSITNGLVNGIEQIPPLYLRASRILGLGRIRSITRVVLPAALPGYLSGLEQGWAFAWRSLMAAELIAVSPELGGGLGQLLEVGRTLGDMSLIVASILLILVTGICVEKLVFAPVRKRVMRNRGLVPT